MLPRARKKDLVIEKLDAETLVYDLRNDQAHCLNNTASLVWRFADGKTDVGGIAKKIALNIGQPVGQDVVRLALQNLTKARLLDDNPLAGNKAPQVSRRDVIKSIGKSAAIALPLITSIVAPEAVQAASCIPTSNCSKAPAGSRPAYSGRCCCSPTKSSCNAPTGTCTANVGCK